MDKYSLVGKESVLEARVSVKSSSIGDRCVVGQKTKLLNCVVFDNVRIAAK